MRIREQSPCRSLRIRVPASAISGSQDSGNRKSRATQGDALATFMSVVSKLMRIVWHSLTPARAYIISTKSI